MRIIGLVNETSGACYHRVYTPIMNMDCDSHITNKLTEEQLQKGCDILVINRFAFYNPIDEIKKWRDKYQFKLVIDIDDYWELPSSHILFDNWDFNNISNIIIEYMIMADIVTCTHERLYERISVYNQNVYILPNAIPHNFEQFVMQKETSENVRIMYQGSITHMHDVELLRNPMKKVYSDSQLRQKISTTFGGHVRNLVDSNSMLSAFTCGLRLKPMIFTGMSPMEYYQIYNHADICLVPLVDSKFNKYKSNLKILEAAYAGIPVIASHINPYLDFPEDCVLYAKTKKDWYTYIKMLTDIEYTRESYGRNLQDFCELHYNFKDINNERKIIYETR